MNPIIELETERLLLRQWKPTDRAPFAAMNADPKVMRYFPAVLTRLESDAMADRCKALIAERGWGFWAVEHKATESFIGFVGLHIPSTELPFSPCVEIGWRLAAAYWRQGYATEAANAALDVGFVQLQLSEMVAFTAVVNEPSIAVMHRLGMHDSGTFEHPALPIGHPLKPHRLFRTQRGLLR
jgi:RimJ/RimL family protein N-acetyltransferase